MYIQCALGSSSPRNSTSCPTCTSEYYMNSNKQCTLKKTCKISEYQDNAVTPLIDRSCKLLTVCTNTEYIKTMHTSTTDRVCASNEQCRPNQYTSQILILNADRVMLQEQKCKEYTICKTEPKQIKIFDGVTDGQGKQDNQCINVINQCSVDEYMVSIFNITANRQTVCQAKKICDTLTEYIHRLGNETRNTECRLNQVCLSHQYINTYSIDSTQYDIIGTNVICNNISKCSAGYASLYTAGNNVICLQCPIGSFSSVGQRCEECVNNTFADIEQSNRCNSCDLISTHNKSFGYERLCSTKQNSMIIPCPVSWKRDPITFLCTPCADGYLLNISSLSTQNRCYICPNNSYCPNMNTKLLCPNIKIFQNNRTVPSSLPGSIYAADCDCSTAGGFEGLFLLVFLRKPVNIHYILHRCCERYCWMHTMSKWIRIYKRTTGMQFMSSWNVFTQI
jgi:hypothetical protein